MKWALIEKGESGRKQSGKVGEPRVRKRAEHVGEVMSRREFEEELSRP